MFRLMFPRYHWDAIWEDFYCTDQSGRNQSTHARLTMPSHLMLQMSSPRFSKANRRDMGDVGSSSKNGTAANFFEVI